ncbi:MAG: hypothetical protein KAH25_02560, partial [Bacteroidales bacterium]|nr:hypothetical protein [Bacteroidales bacterium]
IEEAVLTFIINIAGLLGAIYMYQDFDKKSEQIKMIFIVFIMSMNVTVMTRDMFNLFVFLEIESIAVAGLVLMSNTGKSFQAGMKYLIATGIISGLLLLGIIFAYSFAGSLNIDNMIAANLGAVKASSVAVFLILVAFILELKPFPANGWGLDVYTAAHPGIGAMVSATVASAGIYVLYKIMPIAGQEWYFYVTFIGAITFIGSNLLGTRQENPNRLLGYSSIGQVGLLMMILGLQDYLGDKTAFIAFGILISHYAAKAGLFWISGILKANNIKDWSALRKSPFLLFLFGTFVFALIGFPPFPSFFAKWELIMTLSTQGQLVWIGVILVGSFIEGIYLFRWLGFALKLENKDLPDVNFSWNKMLPIWIMGMTLYILGY